MLLCRRATERLEQEHAVAGKAKTFRTLKGFLCRDVDSHAPCNASVDHFQRHGVTQGRIEGTVGYPHSATAQFVKTAVVAPHNFVMIKTALVELVLHRRFGLHRPAQQTHRATLIVFLGRVRDAAGRTAVWPLALGALKGCFGFHAMRPSSTPQRVFYARCLRIQKESKMRPKF